MYYVYILSNNGRMIYIGVTNNLIKRVLEHKSKLIEGYTSRYDINKLVYYEETNNILLAIQREKQLKNWKRKWKVELIESANKNWLDLFNDLSPNIDPESSSG